MGHKIPATIVALLLGASATGVIVSAVPAQASQALRDHATARGKVIGTAVATGPLANETAYRTIAAREFNQVTAENAMKWDATEPNQGQFSFGGADQVVAFARANNQTVHGHTLVWHSQTPGWVQSLDATALRAAMQNHISQVAGRYAGQIASWDVVNEAFNEDGTLRNSFWLQRLGPSYIADAFRFARAADPTAKLFINDYNTEGQNAKSNGLYNLVRDLRAQGVPIDGVGIQGHLAIQFGFPNDLRQNLERFAALGVDVKITELDVRVQLPVDATKLATQATYYRNVVDACLAVARCLGITIWGFTDKYSWVPGTFPGQGAALPYDENYAVKPAYTAVHDALAGGGPPTDTTPPSQPGAPVASNVTSSGASLSWSASTDNVGVVGYTVYREQGATDPVLATPASNSAVLTGLSASTLYQVYVRARDAAGNLSSASVSGSFTTLAGGGGGGACRVVYQASNWSGANGFTGSVTITNTGSSAVNGWTLRFSFTAGQRVTEGWSATWVQAAGSAAVSAASLSWNASIAPGASVGIGFNGSFTGSNPSPTAFNACTIG
jgi:endo-1,4-beta-xylanase